MSLLVVKPTVHKLSTPSLKILICTKEYYYHTARIFNLYMYLSSSSQLSGPAVV